MKHCSYHVVLPQGILNLSLLSLCLLSNSGLSGHVSSATRRLQPQSERYQLIKAHASSGEITGEHFQSQEYLVPKVVLSLNLAARP